MKNPQVTDEFFNVGTGTKTTINELVHKLLKISGSTVQPEYHPQEHIFVTHRLGSTHKAEKLLGFKAVKDLDEGLRSVVAWRRQDQNKPQGKAA
jgi:nucleoside-diphosphate-sugar epimerase